MGTSHEILQDKINIANMQMEYLMSMIRQYMPASTQTEIEKELSRIEEWYYKGED